MFWFCVLCLWSDQSEFMAISYDVNLQCVLDFYFCQSCGCFNISIAVSCYYMLALSVLRHIS